MVPEVEDLPGYQRGELIHHSSTSAVYRARRTADGVCVVVKRSHGGTVSARQLTRYRNEYELLRSLECRGVVRAFDLARHAGDVALILEEVPGCSLRSWIDSNPGSETDERLGIAHQLAGILAEVHQARVIHKDISSHNILYDPESRSCTLIDFGISTRLRTEESKYQAATALEGTLAYIAPEQTGRMNRSLDYRADLYSLGVTLYELFTGALPHDSTDPLELVHFHIAGEPVPPDQRDGRVPQIVSDIVMKLLRKEPDERYQSAVGLAADLRRCLTALEQGEAPATFTLGRDDRTSHFEPPQKLYGRASETRILLQSFGRVARGSVETIVISGQAGIGKTSLVQEIHQPVTRQRGYFISGKFDQLQRNVPFAALASAFHELVQQLLTESEEAIAAWRSAIQAAIQSNGQLVVDVIPSLELLVGPQPRVAELEALEAQNRFNLVFQSFVQAFCKKSHPLVLFLDDLQWADPASLNLINLIVSGRATESLLVIMTYRESETPAAQPLAQAIERQLEDGVPVGEIELRPLAIGDVAELVADTLHEGIAPATPLAEIVHEKTGGNPFFIRQFLKALHASNLISFDDRSRAFSYDIEAVRKAEITENVADLLATKLQQLPRPTCEALQAAAVVGSKFELRLLATVLGERPEETDRNLRAAIDDGLIAPLTGIENLDPDAIQSPLVYGRLGFLHDRVQQAAYSMLSVDARARLHLAIGRALLAATGPAELENRLFDIVGHLNQGRSLIDSGAELLRLAELNLRAGFKARASTAYDLAAQCLRTAIELMGEQAWSDNEAAQKDAHRQLAEVLSLTADYDGALAIIEEALEHARSPIDHATLQGIKTSVFMMMGRIPEALACGRAAARLFGIDLPERREAVHTLLQNQIQTILERTSEIGIENLMELPVMTEPEPLALMTLLTHCLPAAYQSDQESYALLCCTMVLLSLERGNCPLSARAYGSFAALLSGALSMHEDAYRFAKLGADLAHALEDTSVLAGVYFLWAMFASHWIRPVDESIELFRLSIQYGLQSGDHMHAGYSVARRFSHLQFRGTSLPQLREEADTAMELLGRLKDAANTEFKGPRIRFIAWLEGERRHGNTLGTDQHDEDECTAIIQKRGNRSFESDWFLLLEMQRYYCEDFEAAYQFGLTCEALQEFSAGFVTRVEHAMFFSLTMTALYPSANETQRTAYDAALSANREHMRRWAENCPENYAHMQLLVEAECARIDGARIEAADLFDRAIASAQMQGFTNIEALASEVAARFWFADGKPEFGRLYLEKSLHAYETWGASGKADDLRIKYGLSMQSPRTSATSASTTMGSSAERSDALDLATVLKSSQAIASEIVLERLLASLMDIIMENAGADLAVLVLESDDEFLVQGVKSVRGRTRVLMAEPLRQTAACSKAIVNYVIRTSENVVLSDAQRRGKFRGDAYLANRNPKSVLCAPIVHKSKLTGVVYLENNQVAGAFTPGRLEALNILMTQIAISIENATLYSRQEQQTRTIETANAELTREVAERKRAEHELNRYKDHLEELVKERTKELESAQGRLVDLSRRAGMAEVASGVLHNVGNVMNSVNVGASVARDAVKGLPVEGLAQAVMLLDENADRLPEFLRSDPTGRKLVDYLRRLGTTLSEEKQSVLSNMDQLSGHLEHMKKIIAAQQSYAKVNGVTEICTLEEIAETALAISEGGLRGSNIEIVRDYEKLPPVQVDRHQIMQILVNLISNAKHALEESSTSERELLVAIAKVDGGVRIEVRDNGVGIPTENLPKIFSHGFTTKKKGHGFGLHNCANAAQQLDGSLSAYSDGLGRGASFVLRIPVEYADQLPQRSGYADAGEAR